jgi:hypothetical protein
MPRFAIFVIVVIFCLALNAQAQTLLQVQIVTRHGARSPLTKDASGQVEGGSQLTPVGQKEMYDLGVFMKNRYSSSGILDTYSHEVATFDSSRLDRTVTSANSFALGLYPESARVPAGESLLPANMIPANVPVYTSDWVNDITIRAYDKCPTFSAKLDALYASGSWLAYQSAHNALLTKLGGSNFNAYADSTGAVPLKSVWNCFDAINVAKIECNPDPTVTACTDLEDPTVATMLTDNEWDELKTIANYAELQKYSIANTGDLLGGNLLKFIAGRLTGHTWNHWQTGTSNLQNFYMYSGHYPTLLGLIGAMGENYQSLSVGAIPEYGTAIIFEQWQDPASNDITIKTLYKEGGQDSVIELSLDGACGGLTDCPLANFQLLANSLSFTSDSEWCGSCGNTQANTCLASELAIANEEINKNKQSITEVVDIGEPDCTGLGVGMFILGSMVSPLMYALYIFLADRGYCNKLSNHRQGGQLQLDDAQGASGAGLAPSHQL